MFEKKYLKTWLLTVFAIETLCCTYGLKLISYTDILSLIYFASGITIALLIIFFPEIQKIPSPKIRFNSPVPYFRVILCIVMITIVYLIVRYWLDQIPLDTDYADMLPVIKVMNQRFIEGQWKHIYDTVPAIWNGTRPVYLPAMWLPFAPSVIFNFDPRWITAACFVFVFVLFLFILDFKKTGQTITIMLIALVLFWWLLSENEDHGFLSLSEEGVVVLYYTLLVFALFSGNIVAIGILTSLCMLSRYALIGWIPAFLLYLLLQKQKRKTAVFIVTGIICFLVLFILPFGWKPFVQLTQLPGYYVNFAKIVWKDSRQVFWLSPGFAKFYGSEKIILLHRTLILLTFLVPSLFVWFCSHPGKKRKAANIPLAALKISVVIFYNFIDVPYLYLFYTSSFISLIATASLLKSEYV